MCPISVLMKILVHTLYQMGFFCYFCHYFVFCVMTKNFWMQMILFIWVNLGSCSGFCYVWQLFFFPQKKLLRVFKSTPKVTCIGWLSSARFLFRSIPTQFPCAHGTSSLVTFLSIKWRNIAVRKFEVLP